MVQFAKPTLGMVAYGLNFKSQRRDIRFAQGQAEASFGKWIGVQSTQTNLPDEFDPNAPRIVFVAGQKQVALSQIAVQLGMDFANSELLFDEQFEIVQKNIIEFHRQSSAFAEAGDFRESSLIMHINWQSDADQVSLNEYLYSHFFKQKLEDELASLSFTQGFRRGGLYLNFSTDVYEKRSFQLTPDQFAKGVILFGSGSSDSKVIERGVNVKIDVNSRPRFMQAHDLPALAPEILIAEAIKFFKSKRELVIPGGSDE